MDAQKVSKIVFFLKSSILQNNTNVWGKLSKIAPSGRTDDEALLLRNLHIHLNWYTYENFYAPKVDPILNYG